MVSSSDAGRELAAGRKPKTKRCSVCGQEFVTVGRGVYCSESCKQRAKYRRGAKAAVAAAIARAPESVDDPGCGYDPNDPDAVERAWSGAVVSRSYGELREKLAERRRDPRKAPTKEQVAIRYSPEVLAYFRATGEGWQVRMDAALREWIAAHPL